MQMQDELISYTEKIKSIQDNITSVLSADNVAQEQAQLTSRLDDLATQHAQKILDLNDQIAQSYENLKQKELDLQQSENNQLSDMTDSHENRVADLKEQYQQKMDQTHSQVVRDALQKELDQKLQYLDDSFQREYDTRKKQLDRNNAQELAKAKESSDQQVATLQDRIAKENSAYDTQEAKLTTQSDERIAQYEQENAKKLALYKQELADEERAHTEAMARLKLESSNASAAAAAAMTKPLAGNSPFKAMRRSVQDEMGWLSKFTLKTPFQFKDLVQTDNLLTAFGLNAQQLLPVIGDIGASFHKNIGDSTQAVLDALEGRWQMLKMNFGITKEDLSSLGAQIDKSGQLLDQGSFFRALVKLRDLKFAGGMKNQMDTLGGTISNLQDKWFFFTQSLMSGDTKGKIDKNSIFAIIKDAAKGLGDFLDTHGKDIAGFLHNLSDLVGGSVRGAVRLLGPDVGTLTKDLAQLLKDAKPLEPYFKDLAKAVGTVLVLALKGGIDFLDKMTKGADAVVKAIVILKQTWDDFHKWFKNLLDDLGKKLDEFGKKGHDALSYINPFAHHSPSLVDQVTAGVAQIKSTYANLGNLTVPAPP